MERYYLEVLLLLFDAHLVMTASSLSNETNSQNAHFSLQPATPRTKKDASANFTLSYNRDGKTVTIKSFLARLIRDPSQVTTMALHYQMASYQLLHFENATDTLDCKYFFPRAQQESDNDNVNVNVSLFSYPFINREHIIWVVFDKMPRHFKLLPNGG